MEPQKVDLLANEISLQERGLNRLAQNRSKSQEQKR